MSRQSKKYIKRSMAESMLYYDSEMWTIKWDVEMESRLNALEMNYLRKSEGICKKERFRNNMIRQRVYTQLTLFFLLILKVRNMKWFDHQMRMGQERLS